MLFYLDNRGEWNLNVSTVQFVVWNKEIIQSEKHFKLDLVTVQSK